MNVISAKQRHEEKPRWVLLDNSLHNVSEYANLPHAHRPKVYCPICKQAAILKLGPVRVDHYAHESNIKCNASHPETALHLNTKFHIYNELLKAKQLRIEKACSGNCGKKRTFVWAENWNTVEIEYTIHPIRPDIVLLNNGKNMGAIEIFASHAVDKLKTAQFEKQGLKWIEVKANESVYHGNQIWRAEQPIPHFRLQPDSDEWKCEECIGLDEKRAKYKAQAKEVKDYTVGEYQTLEREAVCEFCGNKTSDWWYYNPVEGICKCRSCYRQGRY